MAKLQVSYRIRPAKDVDVNVIIFSPSQLVDEFTFEMMW